jgi:hypothetical protein
MTTNPTRHDLRRVARDPTGDHDLYLRLEDCGCIRVRCECGHSPQQVVEGCGLTLDDLLCPTHRQKS